MAQVLQTNMQSRQSLAQSTMFWFPIQASKQRAQAVMQSRQACVQASKSWFMISSFFEVLDGRFANIPLVEAGAGIVPAFFADGRTASLSS